MIYLQWYICAGIHAPLSLLRQEVRQAKLPSIRSTWLDLQHSTTYLPYSAKCRFQICSLTDSFGDISVFVSDLKTCFNAGWNGIILSCCLEKFSRSSGNSLRGKINQSKSDEFTTGIEVCRKVLCLRRLVVSEENGKKSRKLHFTKVLKNIECNQGP